MSHIALISSAVVALFVFLLTSVATIGVWIGKTGSRIASLEKWKDEVKADIRDIRNTMFNLSSQRTVEQNSPLRLNSLGQKIADELSLKVWATRTAREVIDDVRDMEEFEIHEYCMDYVDSRFHEDEELSRKIRSTAYQHGLPRPNVTIVFAVQLRDELLQIADADHDVKQSV